MVHDIRVVIRGVHARSFCHGGEIAKQISPRSRSVLTIVHQVRRHGNLFPHHIRKRQHRSVWISLLYFVDDSLVRNLVSAFIGGDDAANLGQLIVASLQRHSRGVPVRNLRRSLLKRRVYETQIRIVVRLRVHPASNQILNSRLDRFHVALTSHPHVLVHQITVSVLFRGPLSRPLRPRRPVRARGILRLFQRVQHVHVRR
mmetsp:Transcript_8855/g.28520  ORF Transcript_8855/g.28520 Transcript_8855/m.28520 type:complete len:201 (+) Transcript_8855:361-963(+)